MMPEYSRFFDHIDGDRVYNAADFAEYFAAIMQSGVLNTGDNLKVYADGSGMQTFINPGLAWINGYLYKNTDEPLTLNHSPADGTYDRIDRVVLRLNLDPSERSIKAFVLEGEADLEPVAPALTRTSTIYEICLAEVLIVHNTATIANTSVTDTRYNDYICGYVRSVVAGVSQYDFEQLESAYNGHFDGQSHVSSSDRTTWNGKQDALPAAYKIKHTFTTVVPTDPATFAPDEIKWVYE